MQMASTNNCNGGAQAEKNEYIRALTKHLKKSPKWEMFSDPDAEPLEWKMAPNH